MNKISEKLRDDLCRLAYEAGEIIREYYRPEGQGSFTQKANNTPYTDADIVSEQHIVEGLHRLTPDIAVIGEEMVEAGQAPNLNSDDDFWLVDALDGTKEFIAGGRNFTVNIALVQNRRPVFGLIYAPMWHTLYIAEKGCGAELKGKAGVLRPLKCAVEMEQEGWRMITSGRHKRPNKAAFWRENIQIGRKIYSGSSIKFGRIAAGQADFYPRLGPTCEWDTAAGDIILREAGGVVLDLSRAPFDEIEYGKVTQDFLNPYFVAMTRAMMEHSIDQGLLPSSLRRLFAS